jgi:hypothetical protein
MRDQDYEKIPPTAVFASRPALERHGMGVGDGETFEALVEGQLNRERTGAPFSKYEILNFGVLGPSRHSSWWRSRKAPDFSPDAVFYVATGREISRLVVSRGGGAEGHRHPVPRPQGSGIESRPQSGYGRSDRAPASRAVRHDILSAVYRQWSRNRARGIAGVDLPAPGPGRSWQEETPKPCGFAGGRGFIIVNLADVYKGEDLAAIRLAEWDEHPNARGHRSDCCAASRVLAGKRRHIQDCRTPTPGFVQEPTR